jgi:uncharacterized protein (DUF1499 family)
MLSGRPQRLTAATFALLFLSCAGEPPSNLGLHGSTLSPCPSSPNCISSDATDASHRAPPFELAIAPADAWQIARAVVSSLPRTLVVSQTPDYLHAECSSALFGFVDDLELQLRAPERLIAVRSASRSGYGDLGVNRARVEELRVLLVHAGAIR